MASITVFQHIAFIRHDIMAYLVQMAVFAIAFVFISGCEQSAKPINSEQIAGSSGAIIDSSFVANPTSQDDRQLDYTGQPITIEDRLEIAPFE